MALAAAVCASTLVFIKFITNSPSETHARDFKGIGSGLYSLDSFRGT